MWGLYIRTQDHKLDLHRSLPGRRTPTDANTSQSGTVSSRKAGSEWRRPIPLSRWDQPGGRLNHALPDLERDRGIDRGMRNTYSTLRGLTGYLNAQRQGRTCENRLGKNANVGEINSHSQPNKNYVTYWDKSYAEQEGHQFSSTRNFLTGRRLSGASEQKKKAGRRRCREVLFPDGEASEVRPGSTTQRELRFSAHRSRGFCLSICLLGL